MPRWYLDTSAAAKLLVDEPESAALAVAIDRTSADLVASRLLETELRRAVHRNPSVSQDRVTFLLSAITVHSLTDAVFRHAGLIGGAGLRSPDALHLCAALAIGADAVVTYDRRMFHAAADVGLDVVSPSH